MRESSIYLLRTEYIRSTTLAETSLLRSMLPELFLHQPLGQPVVSKSNLR